MRIKQCRGPPRGGHGLAMTEISNSQHPITKERLMKILFINNDGGGFADTLDVREGITLRDFVDALMPGVPGRVLLRRLHSDTAAHLERRQGRKRALHRWPYGCRGAARHHGR